MDVLSARSFITGRVIPTAPGSNSQANAARFSLFASIRPAPLLILSSRPKGRRIEGSSHQWSRLPRYAAGAATRDEDKGPGLRQGDAAPSVPINDRWYHVLFSSCPEQVHCCPVQPVGRGRLGVERQRRLRSSVPHPELVEGASSRVAAPAAYRGGQRWGSGASAVSCGEGAGRAGRSGVERSARARSKCFDRRRERHARRRSACPDDKGACRGRPVSGEPTSSGAVRKIRSLHRSRNCWFTCCRARSQRK